MSDVLLYCYYLFFFVSTDRLVKRHIFLKLVNLVMSLVSHGSLYIHLIHLIFLLRLCVDMDDILVLCVIDCCMTTHLLLDCMLLVYVGHTFIPLSPTP